MRYCPNCGTEVDDNAVFCPTCGQPVDQVAETEMPAAPAWPDSPADQAATAPARDATPTPAPVAPDDQTRPERRPDAVPPPAATGPAPSHGPSIDLPVTAPLTLSGWLIGIGVLIAALGIVIGLFDGVLNPIELILLLGLLAIAATVFFASTLPRVPNLQLWTLVVALIGFGIAIDRLGFRGAGAGELLLFLGTAAAAMGAIILELGRDQPLGPSR
jgi:zinc-ribbon domain